MDPNNVVGAPNIQNQPVAPVAPVAPKTPVTPVVPAEPEKKSGKGGIIAAILFAILAVGGVGFGVYTMMNGKTQEDALNEQITTLRKQNSELMEQMGGGSAVNTEDYIYVGEWGVKFKIPDNLQYISYAVRNFDYGDYAGTSLCVSGATTGHGDEKPSFVKDYLTGLGVQVCLLKNTKSAEGDELYASVPVGEYYIQGPQDIVDEANAEWESESVSTISNMLSTENMSNI